MSVITNANGYATGKFTLPADTPVGVKGLVFVGSAGSQVTANFFSDGYFNEKELRVVNASSPFSSVSGAPPVAQVFMVDDSFDVAGISLHLQSIGTKPISIQLRDGDTIIAESLIDAGLLVAAAWNDFNFPLPVFLMAHKKYDLCVFCGDADGAVGVRDVGGGVTAINPLIGELRTSVDGVDYSVTRRTSLAFKVKKAVYNQPLKSINLGSVSVTNASRIAIFSLADNAVGGATSDVVLTLPNGSTVVTGDGQTIVLPVEVTGNINLVRRLRSTASHSAKTCAGTMVVVGGVATEANYVSIPFPALESGCDVRVIFNASLPVGSDVTVYVSGIDVGDNWVEAPIDGIPVDVGGGLFEYKFILSGVAEDFVRARIKLNGTAGAVPIIKGLRIETGILTTSSGDLDSHVAAAHPHAPYKRHADASQVCKVADAVDDYDAVNNRILAAAVLVLSDADGDLAQDLIDHAAAAHPHAPYKRHADSSQVCKVADGVDDYDAVNVGQLNAEANSRLSADNALQVYHTARTMTIVYPASLAPYEFALPTKRKVYILLVGGGAGGGGMGGGMGGGIKGDDGLDTLISVSNVPIFGGGTFIDAAKAKGGIGGDPGDWANGSSYHSGDAGASGNTVVLDKLPVQVLGYEKNTPTGINKSKQITHPFTQDIISADAGRGGQGTANNAAVGGAGGSGGLLALEYTNTTNATLYIKVQVGGLGGGGYGPAATGADGSNGVAVLVF